MKIGADELILWMRKNNIAKEVPNDGINGLGQRIYHIIVDELSGKKIEDDVQAYWANTHDDKNIGKYNLPMTSALYEIDPVKITELYEKLAQLN